MVARLVFAWSVNHYVTISFDVDLEVTKYFTWVSKGPFGEVGNPYTIYGTVRGAKRSYVICVPSAGSA